VSKVLVTKEKKPVKSTKKKAKKITASNKSKDPEPPSHSSTQSSSGTMPYQNQFGAYGMPPPGYRTYGFFEIIGNCLLEI
jgi:hypothetical protein